MALLLLLVLACLALRLPSLDRVALNPDESQYEATASYLLGTGRSAFSLTYGVPGTIAVYRAVAAVFGPYSMWAIRVLVLCICALMAWLLYAIGRAAGSRLAGFAAALVLVYLNVGFEGLSANREWFAGGLVLAGVWLALRADRDAGARRLWLLAASGFVSGMALWFKLQAGYIVLTVPLFLVWRAWADRRWRGLVWQVGCYAAGGWAATGTYLAFLGLGGGLSGYLEFMSVYWRGYVGDNAAVAASNAQDGADYLARFVGGLSGRAFFLVAYATAGTWVAAQARRRFRERGNAAPRAAPDDATLAMFVVYLAFAMLAVQMGQRFFSHYYLLMLPAVAGLFGVACGRLARRDRPAMLRLTLAGLVVAALLLDLVLKLRDQPLPRLLTLWPASAAALAYLVLFVLVLAWGALRPRAHLRRTALGLLLLETALLVARTQLAAPPRSLPHHPDAFPELVARLRAESHPGDRLFVWGWLPEIYSLTRLEAASHYTISQYIVGDYHAGAAAGRLDARRAAALMTDLEQRRPRFVVDAWRRSWTMAASGDPAIYRLDRYPDFGLTRLLRERYDLVGTFDGCALYVRRPDPTSGSATSAEAL